MGAKAEVTWTGAGRTTRWAMRVRNRAMRGEVELGYLLTSTK